VIVDNLRREYSYVESPEFEGVIEGRGPALRAMHRKLAADPGKQAQQKKRLDQALADLLTSDDAFRLVRTSSHGALLRLRTILTAIANPLSAKDAP
jgi:hypothetical protein